MGSLSDNEHYSSPGEDNSEVSDLEDIEAELYAQVYFEANPNYVGDSKQQLFEYSIEDVPKSASKGQTGSFDNEDKQQSLSVIPSPAETAVGQSMMADSSGSDKLVSDSLPHCSRGQRSSSVVSISDTNVEEVDVLGGSDSETPDADWSILLKDKQRAQSNVAKKKQEVVVVSDSEESDVVVVESDSSLPAPKKTANQKTVTKRNGKNDQNNSDDDDVELIETVDIRGSGSMQASSATSSSSDDDDSSRDSSAIVAATITTNLHVPLVGTRNTGHRSEVALVAEILNTLGECDWKVSDTDISGQRDDGRYYKKSRFRCMNCNEAGHLARQCTRPRKQPVCIQCGRRGHYHHKCSVSLCYNCNRTGHDARACPRPAIGRNPRCKRCNLEGHVQEDCTDLWRQYHMTTVDGELNIGPGKIKDARNSRRFCSNCAKAHYTYTCQQDMMERHMIPLLPFISRYDSFKSTVANKSDTDSSRLRDESTPGKAKVAVIKTSDSVAASLKKVSKSLEKMGKGKVAQSSNSKAVVAAKTKVKEKDKRKISTETVKRTLYEAFEISDSEDGDVPSTPRTAATTSKKTKSTAATIVANNSTKKAKTPVLIGRKEVCAKEPEVIEIDDDDDNAETSELDRLMVKLQAKSARKRNAKKRRKLRKLYGGNLQPEQSASPSSTSSSVQQKTASSSSRAYREEAPFPRSTPNNSRASSNQSISIVDDSSTNANFNNNNASQQKQQQQSSQKQRMQVSKIFSFPTDDFSASFRNFNEPPQVDITPALTPRKPFNVGARAQTNGVTSTPPQPSAKITAKNKTPRAANNTGQQATDFPQYRPQQSRPRAVFIPQVEPTSSPQQFLSPRGFRGNARPAGRGLVPIANGPRYVKPGLLGVAPQGYRN